MKKYLIEFLDHKVNITFVYDDEDRLISFTISGTITDKFYQWFIKRVPISTNPFFADFQGIKKLRISEIPEDLSFDRFWNLYDLKISNKKRSETKWKSMSEVERQKALMHLKVYFRHLFENPTQSKKHAETYLNSDMWNN